MYHLSEKQIKPVAIRFLKNFYKDRPRQGNTTTGYDLEASGNVVVDGYLMFQEEGGKEFSATFEASCSAKKDEVYYKLRIGKLLLESFAISSAIVLFGLAIALTYRGYLITFRNLNETLLMFAGSLLGIGLLAMLLINRKERFRYIYAIEQFKRYHANEQWVVIADDVFDSPLDKYLLELKKQCIKNGFGLFSINPHLEGQLMITPSRGELFEQKRSVISKLDQNADKKLKVNKLSDAFTSFKNIFKRTSKKKTSTSRFINYNYWPALTSILSVMAIGSLFYAQLRDKSKVYVKDELGYRNHLSKMKSRKEAKNYLIDTLAMEEYPFLAGIGGALSDMEYVEDLALQAGQTNPDVIFPGNDMEENPIKFLITVEDGSYYTYDCERLFHFKGTNYILQDNVFKMWSNAFNRIRFLKEKGIFAHAIQTSCFEKGPAEYIVFYEIIFDKKGEAEAAFPDYMGEIEASNIVTSNAKIRALQF